MIMFLSYLDSSGRPERKEKENFIVASLTTHEMNWQYIDNETKRIKLNHFPNIKDTDVEFHAKDMLNKTGIYKGLDWDKIYSIFDDIFSLIVRPDIEVSIIASAIIKEKIKKQNFDVEKWGYRFLFERLNWFLQIENEKLLEVQQNEQFGIMIIDTEGETKDQKLRNKLTDMLHDGTFYSKLDLLIEDPLFTDSKWRNLSQLVDCVAFCIRKEYRTCNKNFHTPKWENYFQMIKPKFYAPYGTIKNYGLKVFPEED